MENSYTEVTSVMVMLPVMVNSHDHGGYIVTNVN